MTLSLHNIYLSLIIDKITSTRIIVYRKYINGNYLPIMSNGIQKQVGLHIKVIQFQSLYSFDLFINMQDQNICPLPFHFLDQDSQLINIFYNSDQIQEHPFMHIQQPEPNLRPELDNLSLKEGELEKGYASDASPQKKTKSKRIKKRKTIGPMRVEASKERVTQFYIQSLENRVGELEREIERLKSLNKINLQYIKKISESELIINGFFQHRQKIVEKLQKLTNAQTPDQRKIRSECLALKHKQGSYGQDRIKCVQYYFRHLIKMMATNSHKYLAEAARKNSDLFNPASIDTWEEWRKEMFLKLQLSPAILSIMSQKKNEVMQLNDKFNQKILQMYNSNCELLKISRQIQKLYEQMNEELTPLQTGRLLCFLQKYKFQNNQHYGDEELRKMYQQLSDQTRFSYDQQHHLQSFVSI